jgi:protein gp37
MATRFKKVGWGPDATRVRTSPANWKTPRKWDAQAAGSGKRFRVFCASLADVFEERADLAPWRDDLHELIRDTPNLDWLVLTKRPELAASYYRDNPIPANVWLGTTAEDRRRAIERIPILAQVPAKVRFLSIEPLLDDLGLLDLSSIHWVIVGGESGPWARPMKPEWVRPIRDQCAKKEIPFFFKQWSGRVTKPLGRELDGIVHSAFPG